MWQQIFGPKRNIIKKFKIFYEIWVHDQILVV